DGIRDRNVTGVQTCALPIWICSARAESVCDTMSFPSPLRVSVRGTACSRTPDEGGESPGGRVPSVGEQLGALQCAATVRGDLFDTGPAQLGRHGSEHVHPGGPVTGGAGRLGGPSGGFLLHLGGHFVTFPTN